jgi:hypothetical protein
VYTGACSVTFEGDTEEKQEHTRRAPTSASDESHLPYSSSVRHRLVAGPPANLPVQKKIPHRLGRIDRRKGPVWGGPQDNRYLHRKGIAFLLSAPLSSSRALAYGSDDTKSLEEKVTNAFEIPFHTDINGDTRGLKDINASVYFSLLIIGRAPVLL